MASLKFGWFLKFNKKMLGVGLNNIVLHYNMVYFAPGWFTASASLQGLIHNLLYISTSTHVNSFTSTLSLNTPVNFDFCYLVVGVCH